MTEHERQSHIKDMAQLFIDTDEAPIHEHSEMKLLARIGYLAYSKDGHKL